jgi:hypothetical protein
MKHLLALAGVAAVLAATPAQSRASVILTAPNNVAPSGTASVYLATGGGLITPVANANDQLASGNILNNLMTITGSVLGIQINLPGATDLVELGAYVDPNGGDSDPFKNTSAVRFFVSTNNGASYTDLGLGTFGPVQTIDGGRFSYVNLLGTFNGVTNIRYQFTQAQGGAEGQRIPEVLAIETPEPATIAVFGLMAAGGAYGIRRRLKAAA